MHKISNSRVADAQSMSIRPSTSAASSLKPSYLRSDAGVSGASMPMSDFILRYVTLSMPVLIWPRSWVSSWEPEGMGWLRCCGSDRVGIHWGCGFERMVIAISVSSLFLDLFGREIGTSSNSTSESESVSCSFRIEAGDILGLFCFCFDIDIICRVQRSESLVLIGFDGKEE